MWHAYALLAHDIIRDRQREAAEVALARRAAVEEVARGGLSTGSARRATPRVAAHRRVPAALLRRVAGMAGSLAAAARGMAARLEGRVEGRMA